MSSLANWSYTAPATLWRLISGGKSEAGDPLPQAWVRTPIFCDYQGGLAKRITGIGAEITVKNTVWTEYADAKAGDFLLLAESTADTPPKDADEIVQVIRYADTFDRQADDFALLTGV